LLEGLSNTLPGEPLTVYTYGPYPFYRVLGTRAQGSALLLSLLKFVETQYLWGSDAPVLALSSAVPFVFFFISACVAECVEIFLAGKPPGDGNVDLIAGALPTCKKIGGEKKVVLGVLTHARRSIWWRLVWAIGGALHTASLLITYLMLSKMPPSAALVWAAFQLTWLALRVVIYYFTDTVEPLADRMTMAHQWENLDPSMRARVFSLTLAVAKYQVHVHPRDADAYGDDSFSPQQIAKLLGAPQPLHGSYTLPSDFNPLKSSTIEVNIAAVIGDTTLSSASWMVGSRYSAMDLYDSCIVVFSFPLLGSQTIAIPAARVLSGMPVHDPAPSDTEKWTPVFIPRGAGSRGTYVLRTWWYWIPCGSGRWLQIRSDASTVLGKRTAEVLDDGQLSSLLGAGKLNIGLAHVREVREITDISRMAAESLHYLMN
jgi:hypothetical protein